MTPEESRALVTTKTIHEMDYSDFDRLVTEVYGHEFEITAAQELGNDSAWTGEGRKGYNEKYNLTHYVEKFKKTGDYGYITSSILNDLVDQGYLPEGEYVIEISW